jgi:drug/metabolite transporter (DMT)-like permease
LNGFVHHYAPHTAEAIYGVTILSAVAFALIGAAVSWWKGCGFQPVHVIMQCGSGATFPVFVLMPFVPFDRHLIDTMAQSWVTVGIAGLLGAGVAIYALFQPPSPLNGNGGK